MVLGIKAHHRFILMYIKKRKRRRCTRRMRRQMCMRRSRDASKQRKAFRNQSGLHDFPKGIRVGEASKPAPPHCSARRNTTSGHGRSEPPPAALWQLTMITANCSSFESIKKFLAGITSLQINRCRLQMVSETWVQVHLDSSSRH